MEGIWKGETDATAPPLACLVSLGCAKNLVDSEMMVPQLLELGFQMTGDVDQADLVLVNTCGFLESAVSEAIETILDLATQKDSGRCRCLVVTGCMVQRYGKKLLGLLPEVDLFLGTSHVHFLEKAVLAWQEDRKRHLWIGPPRHLFDTSSPRLRAQGSPSAYLKISEGCSNRCSFCMIPRLRGPQRSRTLQDLVMEAERLASEGVRELNVIAQDTTAFGFDRGERNGLVDLLEALDTIGGLQWIRLLYTYPEGVTESLLHAMRRSRKLVHYLDIPLQHCVPKILEVMGRGGKAGEAEGIVDGIRARLPGVTLRTSLMVGFPGETNSDFEELVRFVEAVQFDHVGVFAFSPETGSRAARLRRQVDPAVREERRRVLMEIQKGISRRKLRQQIGRVLPVLVEGYHPETEILLSGRLASQAPEVDGNVIITKGVAGIGDIVPAEITDAHVYDVEAKLVCTERSRSGEAMPREGEHASHARRRQGDSSERL